MCMVLAGESDFRCERMQISTWHRNRGASSHSRITVEYIHCISSGQSERGRWTCGSHSALAVSSITPTSVNKECEKLMCTTRHCSGVGCMRLPYRQLLHQSRWWGPLACPWMVGSLWFSSRHTGCHAMLNMVSKQRTHLFYNILTQKTPYSSNNALNLEWQLLIVPEGTYGHANCGALVRYPPALWENSNISKLMATQGRDGR